MTGADQDPFSVAPTWTGWDDSVRVQQDALWESSQAGDLMGQARAHNALGMLCLRRGWDSSAYGEFRDSLAILERLGDSQHTPVVRMNLAQSRIDAGLYMEAEEILIESLAVFRERGDTACEGKALRLLAVIQAERKCWVLPDPGIPARPRERRRTG